MMEIIILPYMAISFLIGWAIFSPLADLEGLDAWTFARFEMSDLFGVFVPVSLLFSYATWALKTAEVPVVGWSILASAIILFSFLGLVTGLYVLAKMKPTAPLKRLTLIGVVIPLGSLLTVFWFAIPVVAMASSVVYSIPAAVALVPITLVLRWLSHWIRGSRLLA
jgi:hypothetical protein